MFYSYSFSVDLSKINLNRIQYWINAGRLDPTQPITLKELTESRCIHSVKDGVKLLARGKEELTSPINIIVSRASADAIDSVEKAGGTVTTRFYSKFAIQKILKGDMDPINSLQSRITMSPESTLGAESTAEAMVAEKKRFRYRLPDPTSRKHLEYYRDSAHRGYLSYTVAEGHGPSLFFRTPGTERVGGKKGKARPKTSEPKVDNRLW